MPSYEWTQVAFWKHPHLSYILFIVISVLGGLAGLDHLYLRSPLTAILKAASNLVLPGFWWLYDLFQATAEKETFLQFGLTTPFVPSSGIGAGIFKPGFLNPGEEKEVPDKEKPPNSLWFMAYSLLALLPIGLDHFLVGDTSGGFLKLWLTVMFLFPLGFLILPLLLTPLTWGFSWIWSLYNMFRVIFKTDRVFTQGIARLGVPGMDPFFMGYGKLSSLSMNPEGVEEEGSGLFARIKAFITFIFFGWIKKIPFLGDIILENITKILEILKNLPIVGQIFALLLKIKDAAIAAKDAAIIVAKSTVVPAMAVAGEVGKVVAHAPADGAAALGIIKDGIGEKLAALPPPSTIGAARAMQQSGGALLTESNSFTTLALIGVVGIIASFSIGKYLFAKYHSDREVSLNKAHEEMPPSRRDFAKEKDASKGNDEVTPIIK